jgi:hypothetical protein
MWRPRMLSCSEVCWEIQGEYLALLHKVHNLLRNAYGSTDPNTVKGGSNDCGNGAGRLGGVKMQGRPVLTSGAISLQACGSFTARH